MLTGKNDKGEIVVLDDKIPNEFALKKTAEECGEFYPHYTNFVLTEIEHGAEDEK